MALDDMIRAAVRDYNSEFTLRAWGVALVGGGVSLFTYAVVMLVSLLMFYGGAVPWYLAGTGIYAVFMAIAWWACRRGADPIGNVTAVNQNDRAAMRVARVLTGVRVSPRHVGAVMAGLFIHGPASVIEARLMLSSRLPADEATIRGAGATLVRLLREREVLLAEIEPKTAALVLVRTGYAKPDAKGSLRGLVATVKAREETGRPLAE